jgi:cation diffusion facilitator CzcD-associated flavoprotein CzcO
MACEAAALWRVTLADGTVLAARVLVTAWGQLNRPAMPEIPGLASFAGAQFHSARWRHDVPLAGKRVGCIGSAASAVQLVPPVAAEAAHLTLFQRSPNWVVPRMDRPYTPEEVATFQADPARVQALRDGMYTEREGRVGRTRLDNSVADETRRVALAHLAAQVPDPALRARLTPDYAIGCRRILVSDDFYPALTRDNVELVTDPILRAEPEGIVTADGRLHRFDVLIFATGFETHSFLGLADVTGRDGVSLRASWREGAMAYAGLTVAGFPNMFMLYGPNTNLGHSSIIAMLEAQYRYIRQALDWVEGGPRRSLQVRETAMAGFNETLQRELLGSAWTANCNSWYKTASGRIVNNWSGTVEAYRQQVARLRLEDYDLRDGAR